MLQYHVLYICPLDVIPSSHGNEFVVGFARALAGFIFEGDEQVQSLLVTTSESNPVSFLVTGNGFEVTGTAMIDSTVSIPIPSRFSVLCSNKTNKGIRVKAEGDRTLSVSAITTYRSSSDAFMVMPCTQLSVTEYTYYGISYSVLNSEKPSLILLVACENNTIVSSSFVNITLNELETYQIASESDLTGTRIVSNKPLSVFSGHACAEVPSNTQFCEHLIEQIPPTETWGSRFLIATLLGANSGRLIRIVSSSPSSVTVTIYCNSLPSETLSVENSSEYLLAANSVCFIESSVPVLIGQYAYGVNDNSQYGAPFMMIIPPIEQYSNSITFEPFSNYSDNYMTIYVPFEFHDTQSIILDGSVVQNAWNEVFCSYTIPCGYVARLPVAGEHHQVKHLNSSARIAVSYYGFDTSDTEFNKAYGTSGGYNLNTWQGTYIHRVTTCICDWLTHAHTSS